MVLRLSLEHLLGNSYINYSWIWRYCSSDSSGQFFASIIMILGYSIIAVPTGLISVELSKISLNTQSCRSCSLDEHEDDAIFCKLCGEELNLF